MRKSSSQWSFANNSATAYSQFLSFKSVQEQGGSHNNFLSGVSQRSLGLEKVGGSHHVVHGHPWQPKDIQTNPPSLITTAIGAPPSNGPVVGSTNLKNAPSISIGPCQLTLFYNGSVCVYDNVSSEKAQAIMLLAGNGDSTNSNALASVSKVQPPVPRPPVKDTAFLNHPPGFSSPVSLPKVQTPVSSLSAVPSSCAVEVNPIKPVLSLSPARVNCPEPPKTAAPVGASAVKSIPSAAQIGASAVKSIPSGAPIGASGVKASGSPIGTSGVKSVPSAVPQARKASLARFLEKRKDRVIAAAPYVVNKNGSECNTTGASGSTFLVNSASSTPLPAT